MFSKNSKPVTSGSNTNTHTYTRVGEGVQFQGNIICKGDVRIDGHIQGNISTTSRIIIGTQGKVLGDIKCGSAEIEGKIKGKLEINGLLSLSESADVEGEIEMQQLAVNPGAKFNVTSCRMTDKSNPKIETKK